MLRPYSAVFGGRACWSTPSHWHPRFFASTPKSRGSSISASSAPPGDCIFSCGGAACCHAMPPSSSLPSCWAPGFAALLRGAQCPPHGALRRPLERFRYLLLPRGAHFGLRTAVQRRVPHCPPAAGRGVHPSGSATRVCAAARRRGGG